MIGDVLAISYGISLLNIEICSRDSFQHPPCLSCNYANSSFPSCRAIWIHSISAKADAVLNACQ